MLYFYLTCRLKIEFILSYENPPDVITPFTFVLFTDITSLKNSLFKDYNKLVRPNFGGEAVVITHRIELLRIISFVSASLSLSYSTWTYCAHSQYDSISHSCLYNVCIFKILKEQCKP